jgi:EAL domain-containing protein (putative c-di-GMP-specific phosphodiesterase class I)/GGDEF domain-containing protein
MGLLSISQLVQKLDGQDDIRLAVMGLLEEIKQLRSDKRGLLTRTQELLRVIDEQTRRSNELRSRMEINPKTGLANHLRMDKELTYFFGVENPDRPQRSGALLLVRLDKNYDTVQRTLKPQMSEWILYQLGERLRTMFRDRFVFHTRESEFLILVEGKYTTKTIEKIARALRREVHQPHIFTGYNVHIGCTVGISLFPDHGYSKSYLLQNADIALQHALDVDQGIGIYHEGMRDQVIERMDLQNSIIKALEQQALKEMDKQFEMYFQPIVSVLKRGGEFQFQDIYAEALIRWHHPRLGLVNPGMFIPLAEETGLIIPIGNWVLFTVARHLEEWFKSGVNLSGVSINLSPRQFRTEDVVENITRILNAHEFPSRMLWLEITESTLIEEPMRIISLMQKLHNKGIRFAIDDFGTGYSSLSYVHRMPVGHLKIDQSFIKNVVDDAKSQAIVRTIIAMAKELGFDAIAEGVETLEQADYLYNEGVRIFQGFYFAKPMPSEDFTRFLEANQAGAATQSGEDSSEYGAAMTSPSESRSPNTVKNPIG